MGYRSVRGRRRRWQLRTKRAFDVAVAGAGLAAVAPLGFSVAVAIRATMGKPVMFRQTRVGKDEQLFRIHKFRTMRDPRYEGEPDAPRITRLGAFLRSSSLDELPQLLDVLRGDMSVIGPRPLLVRYLDRYSPTQRRRHGMKPGITGWAQVNGRNSLSWDDKFALDVEYVDNWSLGFDARVLLKTVTTVLARDGISADAHATMPEFMGPEQAGS